MTESAGSATTKSVSGPKAKLVIEIPADDRQHLKMIAAAKGTTTATIIRDFIREFITKSDAEAESDWALAAVKRYEASGKKSAPLSELKASHDL
jgi:hypothetical protein